MRKIGWLGVLALASASAGCGDGGTPAPIGGGATPAPSPAPTASPSSPANFASLGQTAAQTFASYGYTYRATDTGFGYAAVSGTVEPAAQPTLRLAAGGQLFLTVPGRGEDLLTLSGGSATNPTLGLISVGYSALGGIANVSRILKPGGASTLSDSAQGTWISAPDPARPSDPYLISTFIYGVPTPATALPASGIHTYRLIRPDAVWNLTVDFSARTVTGSIEISTESSVLVASLQNVVFTGTDGRFSGEMVTPDGSIRGTFEGRLTGPTGAELIGRYTFPLAGGTQVGLWSAYRV